MNREEVKTVVLAKLERRLKRMGYNPAPLYHLNSEGYNLRTKLMISDDSLARFARNISRSFTKPLTGKIVSITAAKNCTNLGQLIDLVTAAAS